MLPKVTIITPTTYDRLEFNERIKHIGEAQDYPHYEHLFDYGNGSIGEKLNRLCGASKGDIIVRFDSDDIYSPDYVSRGVEFLLYNKAHVTGINECYFYNPYERKAWVFRNKNKDYVIGSGMCFYKSIWQKHPFKHINSGEDSLWIENLRGVKAMHYNGQLIATIHGYNTASHAQLKSMKRISHEIPENIINSHYNTV